MKALRCAALLALLPTQEALAWGQEGHSIIGEIAQREMKQSTRDAIDTLPGANMDRETHAAAAVSHRRTRHAEMTHRERLFGSG
jgi:hypothetical protein